MARVTNGVIYFFTSMDGCDQVSISREGTKWCSPSVLGFPRIGANREVKKAVEAYWAGKISAADLQKAAADVRKTSWSSLKERKVDLIPSGEFTLYDHVLNHSTAFNVIPKRYLGLGLSDLDVFFAMGRGRQADGVDVPACEMKKWFDSNYHYVVPELSDETDFKLLSNKALQEYTEAKGLGVVTRPVVLGPISYLVLGKAAKEASPNFQPISLLPKILPVYKQLVVDEPILALDKALELDKHYATAYAELVPVAPKIMLTTYFARLDSNLNFIAKLPVAGLHIDLARAPKQLDAVLDAVKSTRIVLSLGVVSGRNIWKTDFNVAIRLGQKAIDALGQDRVVIATSSSLLHTPVTLANEKKLNPQQKDWFSFALEKAAEVATIAAVLSGSQNPEVAAALEANKVSIAKRREFEHNSDDAVRKRVAAIEEHMYHRKSPFATRKAIQAEKIKLPKFPTTYHRFIPCEYFMITAVSGVVLTTSWSKPTRSVMLVLSSARAKLPEAEYEKFIAKEIDEVVRFQEEVGLDLLVHGEPERNDMVQYFGERLSGFVFTQNGWVQSYGSRYVRPPIIVSDVSRPEPMTVRWSSYAQSVTTKPVKVVDLEGAGIAAIQVDEPAIREGLPLRSADWDEYLQWAVDTFKLATAGVRDDTQTHSHFCYSDFGDIFPSIQRLDADVISIEFSKSDMKLLHTFKQYGYSNEIGPGVYDIHSPRIPSEQEIIDRLKATLSIIPSHLVFVNPDCGLKTRGWKETKASLTNLVNAARWARLHAA
ncbi:cobalamin-independent synthase [Chiua virens]|nr:cobalamin-independent synthase [Chiua virens]